MSFKEIFLKYENIDFDNIVNKYTKDDAEKALDIALNEDNLSIDNLLALISPASDSIIERMALYASKITSKYFGKEIILYAPLYISNYCTNSCRYCSFNNNNHIKRNRLTFNEIENEAKAIKEKGIRHLLILTGEKNDREEFEYILSSVKILRNFFPSLTIEVFPMERESYEILNDNGVIGLTIYQETYNQNIYKELHPSGPKSDFFKRLDTPQKGAEGGLRSINIGALLGLGNYIEDLFFTALHGKYLTDNFIESEISLSIPRITTTPHTYTIRQNVDNFHLLKAMLVLRLYLPRAGITLSTRESKEIRNALLGFGVTKYSAGSKTGVGGYSNISIEDNHQFQTVDKRSVDELTRDLKSIGYQPVNKDWEMITWN